MSSSVKSKFKGLFRSLLQRFDGGKPARPVPPPAPAHPPVAGQSARSPLPPPAQKNSVAGSTGIVELPLAVVVAALPADLRAKLVNAPAANATLSLAADTVMSQLVLGAVKISFGELRQLAPGIFTNTGGELDNRPINLPLGEILSRVNPALLARHPVKKVEVADEIVGPFGSQSSSVTFTTQPLKSPPVPAPAPTPAPAPAPPVMPAPTAPIAFKLPSASPRPAGPPPVATPVSPSQVSSAPRPAGPPRMVLPAASSNANALPTFSMKAPAPAAAPVAAPAPAPLALPPELESVRIFASLAELSERWPEELKQEIQNSPLARSSVALGGSIIGPGLQRGRVVVAWKQLRLLAAPDSVASVHDLLELELPLKVIAPLYLAATRNLPKARLRAAVSAEIPDLFFGFPQPAAPPPVPAMPAPVSLPMPSESKNADTNFYARDERFIAPLQGEPAVKQPASSQTDFLTRQAHPKEVVIRATQLPGVAGAVVALPDGLRVASQVAAELNADVLAAFLPQIYERVNQSTRELRMGALNNVSFTVGNVPWKIFRVNSVYFAAFGRAGEGLPSAQLAALAAEIDRKKQS